jgi:hypothetical protein
VATDCEVDEHGVTEQVFVSYSHHDASLVTPVVRLLRSTNDFVFQDSDSIRPGTKWREALTAAIEQANLVVVFWCLHSSQSTEVEREYRSALEARKDVLTRGPTLDPHLRPCRPLEHAGGGTERGRERGRPGSDRGRVLVVVAILRTSKLDSHTNHRANASAGCPIAAAGRGSLGQPSMACHRRAVSCDRLHSPGRPQGVAVGQSRQTGSKATRQSDGRRTRGGAAPASTAERGVMSGSAGRASSGSSCRGHADRRSGRSRRSSELPSPTMRRRCCGQRMWTGASGASGSRRTGRWVPGHCAPAPRIHGHRFRRRIRTAAWNDLTAGAGSLASKPRAQSL